MKNFKRVLSLALAVLMVIGGLVIAPVDAKAETTYTRVTSVDEIAEGGQFVIVAKHSSGNYALSSTYSGNWMRTETVELDADNNITSATAPVVVIEKGTADGQVYIKAGSSYVKGANENKIYTTTNKSDALTQWTVTDADNDGEIQFKLVGATDARSLVFNYSSNTNFGYRPYKDATTGAAYVRELLVYKVSGEAPEQPKDIELPADATPDQIIEAAYKAKDDGVALLGTWTLTGVIQSITDAYTGGSDYKNVDVTIKVGDNEKLMRCYRVVNGTNVTLDDLQGLGVGDTITVTGTISYYGTSVQYIAGSTIDKIEKAEVVIPDIELPATATPEEIINAAYKAKEDGVHLLGTWTLTGVITKITDAYAGGDDFKNVDVTIKVGDIEKVMRCYRVGNGTDVTLDDLQGLAEGDTITVTGTITWYGDSVQFAQGSTIDKVVKANVEEPEDPEQPEDPTDEMTAEEILAEAAKLADGAYLGGSADVKFTLKGVITEFTFNEQYGDANLTIKVDGTDETFYCYQVKGDAVKDLKVGSHIELNGAIKNYKGTIEFERPNLVSVIATGDFSMALPLVLVLMGGAAVIVASKKRFA